jgi:hypothetical protein
MRFNSAYTESRADLDLALVQSYIQFMGEIEPQMSRGIMDPPDKSVWAPGLYVGRGCLMLAIGNEDAADRLFSRALESDYPKDDESRDRVGSSFRGSHVYRTAELLESRESPSALEAVRLDMHSSAIERVKSGITGLQFTQKRLVKRYGRDLQVADGVRSTYQGELAEDITLAHLSRPSFPRVLSLPSLYHHDNSRFKMFSYDLVVVGALSNLLIPEVRQVQTKHQCLGFCCNQNIGNARTKYSQDIVFISGHCDLGIHHDRNGWKYPTVGALIRESEGSADTNDIRQLDRVTGRLFNTIFTAGQERRGLQNIHRLASRPHKTYKN